MSFSENQCSKRKRAEGAKRFENSGRVNQEGAGQEISYQRNLDQRQKRRAEEEYKASEALLGILPSWCGEAGDRAATATASARSQGRVI